VRNAQLFHGSCSKGTFHNYAYSSYIATMQSVTVACERKATYSKALGLPGLLSPCLNLV